MIKDIDLECKLLKHEETLRQSKDYKDLNNEILEIERKIISCNNKDITKLFLDYTNLHSKQTTIAIIEALKTSK